MKSVIKLIAAVFLLIASSGTVAAGKLVINSQNSDQAPKAAFARMVQEFQQAYPEIEVELNIVDRESFKTALRNWLTAEAPDIVTWYAGNRMITFVKKGLFEDVTDVWTENNMYENFASTAASLTVDGRQYGVPYTYYQWGIYYRKDIFEKYAIAVPETWSDFLAAGETLRANGIVPVAIGTKFLWPAAGWFDYLNLRTNGLEFHMDLMLGKAAYTDPRVRNTFAHWRELIDRNFFIDSHSSYSWQEAQPFLYNGSAAMYLIGNFITPNFTEDLANKMGFFQFPVIDPEVALAEDAPTDTFHIPSRSTNKEDARKFLAFAARADQQQLINEALLQLPPHKAAQVKDDPFLDAGAAMLAQAAGTAQFYDRDTTPEMAKIGMQGFQEFMMKPDNLDKILARLERARQRIFR